MSRHATAERGFTLVEVLVALTIVAVAMSAAVRASSLMTQNSGMLEERAIALLAAQSRMAELRLANRNNSGQRTVDCRQGRLELRCEQRVSRRGELWLLQIFVYKKDEDGPPLARLETLGSAAGEATP